MKNEGIEQHFAAYSEWRKGLADTIAGFRDWLQQQKLGDTQVTQRLDHILATLRDDKLYIAFVAEFARGKSELINAIFFSKFGQRILPSSAGRTTMCPTELMYDADSDAALRLLPIETRKSGTTIAEYKGFSDEWTTIRLNLKAPKKMAEVLKHIAETMAVDREQAQALGLHVADDESQIGMRLTDEGAVEIPKWRYAMINFPHPLLEQGLVILDTPGLNALGAEPELTLNLLPSAHAVLFVLAADAGVTKSDIDVWRNHIGSHKDGANRGRLVVLNKIDGLWDELRDWDEVQREIDRQIRETARHLAIPEHNIHPVSAQKALYAKIKGDRKTLERSRISALEDALGKELVPAKRDIIRENIKDDLEEIITSTRMLSTQRLKGVREHMDELSGLNGKNMDVIEHMMKKVKIDKEVFEKTLQRFQATRSIFAKQTNRLYTHLNLKGLNTVIAETKKDMEISMTTAGLMTCMQKFFTYAIDTMGEVAKQTQEIKELMEGVYKKFQKEHGLAKVKPGGFSVMRYLREIKRLQTKHEQFTKGLTMVVTEQKAVTDKFFESSVAKVRAIYKMANRDTDSWLRNIMNPMEAQVREHQIQLRRRLESIKHIHQASDTLEDRLSELEHIRQGIDEQEQALDQQVNAILNALYSDEALAEAVKKSA
ncbi:MAG: dynamin-like GTPase family protein [Gammaproteobacteria bacterium]|nr:MAG: dynamin-like GTPase family protein [Gammaproteobacteria bacterium]